MATDRRHPTATDYHRLPIAEKRAQNIAAVRERSVSCPGCDTQVMPEDLLSHVQRCQGRAPEPRDKWVDARHPIVRSIPRETRSRWVERGWVRARGDRMDREYLLRDLAKRIAIREGFRRR